MDPINAPATLEAAAPALASDLTPTPPTIEAQDPTAQTAQPEPEDTYGIDPVVWSAISDEAARARLADHAKGWTRDYDDASLLRSVRHGLEDERQVKDTLGALISEAAERHGLNPYDLVSHLAPRTNSQASQPSEGLDDYETNLVSAIERRIAERFAPLQEFASAYQQHQTQERLVQQVQAYAPDVRRMIQSQLPSAAVSDADVQAMLQRDPQGAIRNPAEIYGAMFGLRDLRAMQTRPAAPTMIQAAQQGTPAAPDYHSDREAYKAWVIEQTRRGSNAI